MHLGKRQRVVKDVGVMLGKKYGGYLKEVQPYNECDIILPVPLHSSKLRKRGYNQSDYFAEGLSEALGIPWRKDVLRRTTATESQTRKSRVERWKNVESIFECVKPSMVQDKRVMLV